MPIKDRFYIGSDHEGLELKDSLKKYLDELNVNYTDLGVFKEDGEVDYIDIGREVAEKVYENKCMGLLISGTGVEMSMMVNKRTGIRAALCTNETMAEYSRRHNNANILCVASKFTDSEEAGKILHQFIITKFDVDRYQATMDRMDDFGGESLA